MKSKSEIFFIGTGAGSVSLKRNHSSFIISNDNYNLLVDAGEDITRNLLLYGIKLNSINSILISHFHPDHVNGIALLINQMKMNERSAPLKIFTHKNLVKQLINLIQLSNIYLKRLTFDCQIIPFIQKREYDIVDGIKFISKLNTHLIKPGINGNKSKLVSSSFLFKINGNAIFYSGDIGCQDDLFLFSKEKPDIFITESTHVSLDKILDAYYKLEPKIIIITHIADDLESGITTFHKKLKKGIREKILIATDKLKFEIINKR